MSSRHTKNIVQLKIDEYLDSQGSEGGYLQDLQQKMLEEYKADPSAFAELVLPEEALCKAFALGWNVKPSMDGDQPDLFSIGGIVIEKRLAFADEEIPGGYRKVINSHATVDHLVKLKEIKKDNLQKVQERYEQIRAAVETAMMRSGGRLTMRLLDIADVDHEPVHPAKETISELEKTYA